MKFEGVYENGQRKLGKLVAENWTYQGGFKSNKYDGDGKLTVTGGYEYVGQFSNGMIHGIGTMKYPNSEYKGRWVNGEWHGYGEQSFGTKEKYYGEFKKGKREGYGRLSIDGAEYAGKWVQNHRHGKGFLRVGEDFINGVWNQDELIK